MLQEAYQYIKSEVARVRTESSRRISRQMQDNKRNSPSPPGGDGPGGVQPGSYRLAAYVETPRLSGKSCSPCSGKPCSVWETVSGSGALPSRPRACAPMLVERLRPAYPTVEETALLRGLVVGIGGTGPRIDVTTDTALNGAERSLCGAVRPVPETMDHWQRKG